MIRIFPDAEALSRAAAELFVDVANQATAAQGRFCACLSGGSTPQRVFELLAQPPLRDRVPWRQTHLFWGDERCVPADDPRSNYRMARRALLDHVSIPMEQVHPIDGSLPPAKSAEQYEKFLRAFFAGGPPCFDLTFLGLGENGHTASLFPHTPVLHEPTRWVREVNILDISQLTATVHDLPEMLQELARDYEIPLATDEKIVTVSEALAWAKRELSRKQQVLERVTLTAAVLNQSARIVFLAAGGGKAKVLREVLEGPADPQRLPAQLIRSASGEVRWMLDGAAAARLRGERGKSTA